ncbi:MAG: BON domain-containing protein [Pyrinomonadaceae bacterium]
MKLRILTIISLACMLLAAAACGKKDADIQKAVQDKLAAVGVTGVAATVKDGTATLTGEVADVTVKKKAEDAAKSVDGVKSVDSKLTTRPLPVATPAANDQALTGKINEDLKKAGCDGATATVVGGRVTVAGAVPESKYVTCIQVINQSGITGIDNQLKKGPVK